MTDPTTPSFPEPAPIDPGAPTTATTPAFTEAAPVAPIAPITGRPPSAFFALYRLFLRFQVTPTRLVSLGGLGLAGVAVGWALGSGRVYNHLLAGADFANVFGLAVFVPLVCLVFSSSIFGDLTDDSTLVYLWLRPIPRHRIVGAAALAALTVALPLAVPPLVLATFLTKGGTQLVGATALAAVVLTFAYVGIFIALGLRVKRPLVWGLLYIFIWEGFVAQGSYSAAKFAMRAYGSSILHDATHVKVVLATFDMTSSIAVPLGVGVAALAYATWRLRRQEVA